MLIYSLVKIPTRAGALTIYIPFIQEKSPAGQPMQVP